MIPETDLSYLPIPGKQVTTTLSTHREVPYTAGHVLPLEVNGQWASSWETKAGVFEPILVYSEIWEGRGYNREILSQKQ